MRLLRPDEYRRSLFAIDLDRLHQRGIRAIIVDLDNTLVPWNDPHPTEQLLHWLTGARARGFAVCICSNNRGRRVEEFAGALGIPFVARAIKPSRRGFRRAMELLGVRPAETAVIGDQLFTDVVGGNRAGAYTILVQPMDVSREFILTRLINRPAERLALHFLSGRGLRLED
jgi:uncharacterized protein